MSANSFFPIWVLAIAIHHFASGAIAAPQVECSEISPAGTTADNKGPALLWTYLISPAGANAAEVSIAGFQTAIKLEATTVQKASGTSYIFTQYAADTVHTRPAIKKGEELFVISNNESGGLQLSFRSLKPNLKQTTIACQKISAAANGENPLQNSAVLLSPETMDKRPVLRLRLRGEEARQICTFLGIALVDKPEGSIFAIGPAKKGKPRMSCFTTSGAGTERFGFGFILDQEGRTFDLEASGYQ